MKKSIFLLIIFLILTAFACNTSDLSFLVEEKSIASGEILFSDDFSDDTVGWDTWVEEDSAVDYNSGGLRFYLNKIDHNFWSRPKVDYKDVDVQVLATRLSGPDDNYYGVICHYQNRENYYALIISSDGYYGVMKVMDGTYHLLNDVTMQYSESIHTGGETNRIQAKCVGPQLTLTVNGDELVSVRDTDIDAGGVGLIVGSYETPGVDILFDNFVVYQP